MTARRAGGAFCSTKLARKAELRRKAEEEL
jgi:hypothetical protein